MLTKVSVWENVKFCLIAKEKVWTVNSGKNLLISDVKGEKKILLFSDKGSPPSVRKIEVKNYTEFLSRGDSSALELTVPVQCITVPYIRHCTVSYWKL